MSLEAMLDKMSAYNRALETHGYVRNGAGVKPWSIRWTLGTSHMDIRNSEWTAYSGDEVVACDQGPGLLNMYLCGDYEQGASI